MSEKPHKHAVRSYIIIAVILAVITYIEFDLVEYPIAWLGQTWTLVWLVALSVVKFVLVVLYFMHLKDDDATYSGFFTSGMIFAMGTFIALSFLFVGPRSMQLALHKLPPTHQALAAEGEPVAAHGTEGLAQDVLDDIATNGYSRGVKSVADNPPPKNQAAPIALPAAPRNTGSYTIGAIQPLLVGASAATAPDGGSATAEPPSDEVAAQTPVASWDTELGTATYNAQCMACHQGAGQGIPGAFPPLADHLPEIYNVEGGRDYLIHTVLFGTQGPIEVLGNSYNGVMPAWKQLSDDEIADVLNHELTSWDNESQLQDFQPILASEVAALRADDLSAQDVHALRESLPLP